MREIAFEKEFDCSCGRKHKVSIDKIVVGSGAIEYVTVAVKKYGQNERSSLRTKIRIKRRGKKFAICFLVLT